MAKRKRLATEDEKKDPDRIYRPMLNGAFSTRTDYDGNRIEFDWMLETQG